MRLIKTFLLFAALLSMSVFTSTAPVQAVDEVHLFMTGDIATNESNDYNLAEWVEGKVGTGGDFADIDYFLSLGDNVNQPSSSLGTNLGDDYDMDFMGKGTNPPDGGALGQLIDDSKTNWPFLPVPGNHDCSGIFYSSTYGCYRTATELGYGDWMYQSADVDFPPVTLDAQDSIHASDSIPMYYAYTLAGWKIFALNSQLTTASPNLWYDEWHNWFAGQVNNLADGTNVLAYFHYPLFSESRRHDGYDKMLKLWNELESDSERLGHIIVMNGNNHSLEVFPPVNPDCTSDPDKGIVEIELGPGGAGPDSGTQVDRYNPAKGQTCTGFSGDNLNPLEFDNGAYHVAEVVLRSDGTFDIDFWRITTGFSGSIHYTVDETIWS